VRQYLSDCAPVEKKTDSPARSFMGSRFCDENPATACPEPRQHYDNVKFLLKFQLPLSSALHQDDECLVATDRGRAVAKMALEIGPDALARHRAAPKTADVHRRATLNRGCDPSGRDKRSISKPAARL
jgi:hypothetical protein